MKRNNKRLYESIMKEVSKTVKRRLNEVNQFGYEQSNENTIDWIIKGLSDSGTLDELAEHCMVGAIEDVAIFKDTDFLDELGQAIYDEVSTIIYNADNEDNEDDEVIEL